jgi:hypothetical protein
VSRVAAAVVLVAALAAAVLAPSATAARGLLKGLYDDTQFLYGNPDRTYPIVSQLKTDVLRVNLYWGGEFGVANRRPANPTNPNDPAYDWGIYDRAVLYAAQYKVQIVFSIWGTPGWANRFRGLRYAPTSMADLQRFAAAAARRYSGTFVRVDTLPNPDPAAEPGSTITQEITLPRVRYWLAWNEPNNPAFLTPQYRLVRGKARIASGATYAKICNAIVSGARSTLLRSTKVACGVTAPSGNNNPKTLRPSVSPIPFMRAMKAGGARGFDAYAHHPYTKDPRRESPTKLPKSPKTTITLANINTLSRELVRLFGNKRLWITEYGYETLPERRVTLRVTPAQQGRYLTQAFAIARKHPRIDMFTWFMLRDDRNTTVGWQSGLFTVGGSRKPAFSAFLNVP